MFPRHSLPIYDARSCQFVLALVEATLKVGRDVACRRDTHETEIRSRRQGFADCHIGFIRRTTGSPNSTAPLRRWALNFTTMLILILGARSRNSWMPMLFCSSVIWLVISPVEWREQIPTWHTSPNVP